MRLLDRWFPKRYDINEDDDLKAIHIPELVGMDFAQGGAYTFDQIRAFNERHAPGHSFEFSSRLLGTQLSWAEEGKLAPYWATLIVLRRLEADIEAGKVEPYMPTETEVAELRSIAESINGRR